MVSIRIIDLNKIGQSYALQRHRTRRWMAFYGLQNVETWRIHLKLFSSDPPTPHTNFLGSTNATHTHARTHARMHARTHTHERMSRQQVKARMQEIEFFLRTGKLIPIYCS